MLHVTFPEIALVLQDLSSSVPASEGHGCLCGALCASAQYTLERWLEEMVPEEDERRQVDRQALELLFTDTLQALRGDAMDLELLLPDDDMPLQSRAAALSQWCQGFLYGFGTGQPAGPEALPAAVDEVLRDFTHIGRASVEWGEGSEEEESAYAEVLEYVRVGVQLIHDELDIVRGAERGSHRLDRSGGEDAADPWGDDPESNGDECGRDDDPDRRLPPLH